MKFNVSAAVLFLFSLTLTAQPNDDVTNIVKGLKYQTGKVILGDKLATLNVPSNFKYINGKQSKLVLENVWGNPPSAEPLGMLFLKNQSPISDNFTYAISIDYSEEGYIKDDDAKDLDYGDLLDEMKSDMKESNESRKKEGYPSVELVGWASPPFYDEKSKKLHWAKTLKFEGSEVDTLNYNIRILGRKGVIVLNVISDADKLPLVNEELDAIVNSTEFNEGNRYEDFNPGLDTVAAYGIGGLIAGKVLAKAGFFALLLKFWKVIALAVIGGFGVLKKFIFREKDVASTPPPSDGPNA
ncbi:DUF2167 domain-containing protein [Leptospira kmetyi]|uniref:DUF2167 domain-containing protein n=1 Tax=Leptospira kmetyi TaxID=408139 RepID=UPI000289FE0A|nr:DUF2167 domain-containing protein [Leptospira kmetyi]EQA53680.1 PF09935 family protein [Leptospira kmetyi serovar Malaysia str. Bejo-Iso9]TGL70520.1 DUF2167 domain-containing protein [Leptospira kmetyi]